MQRAANTIAGRSSTRVAELVQRHPLRGFDAIHLAAAVRPRSELAETVCFIAADSRLLAAAHAEGLDAFDARP